MAKARSRLSAREIEAMHDRIDRRLDEIGIQTQPEVAMRVLELVSDPDSSMKAFAQVVGSDQSLTGRLLRLANSAFYAQRRPVTNLNRACIVVGLERLRAIVLGFYLHRAVSPDGGKDTGREIWAQSLFRACLAAALARKVMGHRSAEAFVIGLMLDCGIPLCERMIGAPFREALDKASSHQNFFCREWLNFPFTHVDVATVLCRRWELPDFLAGPICSHHVIPPARPLRHRSDEDDLLCRIAFAAGSVNLHADGFPSKEGDAPLSAAKGLGLTRPAMAQVTRAAADEYRAVADVFSEFSRSLTDLNALAEQVHIQLQAALDVQLAESMARDGAHRPLRIEIDGCTIEIEPTSPGGATAYLCDPEGQRVASCIVSPAHSGIESLIRAFALENAPSDKLVLMARYIASLAA